MSYVSNVRMKRLHRLQFFLLKGNKGQNCTRTLCETYHNTYSEDRARSCVDVRVFTTETRMITRPKCDLHKARIQIVSNKYIILIQFDYIFIIRPIISRIFLSSVHSAPCQSRLLISGSYRLHINQPLPQNRV